MTNNVSNNRYLFTIFCYNNKFKFVQKKFLELLKTDIYVFKFFAIFLVTKIFNKYIIRYKIKFYVGLLNRASQVIINLEVNFAF